MSERNSPAMAYPVSATNPRKSLSPKSIYGITAHESDERATQIPLVAGSKRPFSYAGDGSLKLKAPPYSHHPSNSLPDASTMASPVKAGAQPVRHMDGRHQIHAPTHTGEYQRHPQGPHYPPHPNYHHGNHGPPHSAPQPGMATTEGGLAWSDMRRPDLGGSMLNSDGQQAYMTLPGAEAPIPVQVDYSQASKKADEKRQRNARASTRHRKKKKSQQEESNQELHNLRQDKTRLSGQVEDLTRQRDFYREERNRLRDIVLRTPAISQHASGPPSPVSTRSTNSYAGLSPMGGQPPPLHTPSQGYLSEASSVERPAQRRRTDDRPEYSTNYSTQSGPPPTSLPPMQSHGHPQGMQPRPMMAHPTTHQGRLPPLRAIDGPPPYEMHSGHAPHERDPSTGEWPPAHPRAYETGWATPRNIDNHQR
ncbi:hypothetical protein G3M48_009287 [Beauveria asiatica]|uniref:BZIP domain-containing protein n=1 Tax=Beauveria asiatica TaxID=1069075 RepID=A0AAW0RJ69_9HYPO